MTEDNQDPGSRRLDPLTGEGAQVILDSVADGVFTVDLNFRVTWMNRAAQKITGVGLEEAVGAPCCEVFRAEICETGCVLRRSIDTGEPVVNQRIHAVRTDGVRLPLAISTAILRDDKGRVLGGVETFRDLSVEEDLRRAAQERQRVGEMLSANAGVQRLFALLPEMAESSATVLIQGESGTGKELIARALHDLGPRSRRPFVPLNMAAVPEALLEAELFGHRAGAYTGAVKSREGVMARAAGGTVFLDEVGEMPPAVQAKLLRFLQDFTFTPLGGDKPMTVDVRVVAATNRDLKAMVEQGRFRQDLFYRLAVLRAELPPLRERPEDVLLLAEHFLAVTARLRGKEIAGYDPEAVRSLLAYAWPGNVRELMSAVEVAVLLCPAGGKVLPGHLPREVAAGERSTTASAPPSTLAELERRAIAAALARNDGKREAAARELGIHRVTLYRRLKALGLVAGEEGGPVDG